MICAASGHETSCFWQRLKSAALRGPRNLGRKKLQRARCIRGGVGAFYRPRFSEIRCKLSSKCQGAEADPQAGLAGASSSRA